MTLTISNRIFNSSKRTTQGEVRMDLQTIERIVQVIMLEFEDGNLSYIQAIKDLEELGFSSTEAEIIVSDWETNK